MGSGSEKYAGVNAARKSSTKASKRSPSRKEAKGTANSQSLKGYIPSVDELF